VTSDAQPLPPPGDRDRARVSVLVAVEPADAFAVFTEEIDLWWRRGLAYRVAGRRRGVVVLEPGVGGRLFERFEAASGTKIVQTGRVTLWEPPARLAFDWRAVNFAPSEWTHVDVTFEARPGGTLVTVTHSGWSGIRPDHPARHGLEVQPFVRMMGMWWAQLLSSLREHAARDGDGGA
jgi:uncharacterized protein YndB with AHSA1/START domain